MDERGVRKREGEKKGSGENREGREGGVDEREREG